MRSMAASFAAVASPLVALSATWLTVACGDGTRPSPGFQGGSGGGSGGDALNMAASASETGGAGCEREVSLQPVRLGEPQPFDLVIVADHSDSLAWSRDALASGLQDLLTNVRGRAARVFLLTPTAKNAQTMLARASLVLTKTPAPTASRVGGTSRCQIPLR